MIIKFKCPESECNRTIIKQFNNKNKVKECICFYCQTHICIDTDTKEVYNKYKRFLKF